MISLRYLWLVFVELIPRNARFSKYLVHKSIAKGFFLQTNEIF